jgi:signal transduction histidine kinase
MTHTSPDPSGSRDAAALRERLRAHRTLSEAPAAELDWLLEHGTFERYAVGEHAASKGEQVAGMYIILKGRLTHYTDRGGSSRKVLDWGEGDVTGVLPYSRMGLASGTNVVDEAMEALFVPRQHVPDMPVTCPHVTAVLVHAMLDRAREFTSSDQQLEKLASLGKLAAGMAHELNNPSSAAVRSARLLTEVLAESDEASRALGRADLSESEQALLEDVRTISLTAPAGSVLSPLERADREEEIIEWLTEQGADASLAAPLAETDLKLETLTGLAGALSADKLGAALRWLAAACTVRELTREIEQASSRVHELVSAVKAFTYMDQGSASEAVDVGKGLADTLAMLAAKARGKAAEVKLEVATDLPRVNGLGGELNQVWANLIDNALDAVGEGGQVRVTADRDGDSVVVRVIDDGPGILPEVKNRIFDPFFTTKPVGSGTGLGLDIAQRLVNRHEGLIAVTSEPERTEFRVTLPVAGAKQGSAGGATRTGPGGVTGDAVDN